MESKTFTPRPPSSRARLVSAATRASLRPTSLVLPNNWFGLVAARSILAAGLAAFGTTASNTSVRKVDKDLPGIGRVRGEWVRAGTSRSDAAILYIHGSGYVACSPRSHRGLVSRLSAATGLPVFSVDYRLAPRHPFPAAADDVQRAFEWLVTSHLTADRIVVAGDSAGGHLAIDLCLDRLRRGDSVPSAIAVFSPLVDVTFRLARQRERVVPDPMTSAENGLFLVSHYVADADPRDSRLSHRFEDGESLPPTLIQAGGLEMLAADAHDLHHRLAEAGTDCELEIWPGQMHVFQAMPRLIPEAQPALNRAARFIVAALNTDPSATSSTRQGQEV